MSQKNCFFVLSNMALSFENVCEIIQDGASEGLEKSLGAVYDQEKEESETKCVPGNLKNT